MNSLDLGYVLHHCNTERLLIYLHVTEYVHPSGNRTAIMAGALLL